MSKTKVLDRFERTSGVVLKCDPKEGRTQQQFKDECDVNIIVERYVKTGNWGSSLKPGTKTPMFGDFTEAPDYQECMDKLIAAQADFDSLPSRLRKRFNNSPYDLLEFLHDPANKDEAIALGLIEKKAVDLSAPAAALPGSDPAKG